MADVERSAFFDGYAMRHRDTTCPLPSRIEGVGRPRMEPSFVPFLIHRMLKVPDAASIAGIRVASDLLERPVGASTGLNFVAALLLARETAATGRRGSTATLICDGGSRYEKTARCDAWLHEEGLLQQVASAEATIRATVG